MGDAYSTRSGFDATNPSYDFGYRFVQGTTNGPGTGGSQFYSWYIGLGSDYAATGAGSYGAMFAVDRNVTTPYLSVRYNENNTFTTWRKISAGTADTLTTARTINTVSFNGSANIDIVKANSWNVGGPTTLAGAGEIRATGNITAYAASDIRLKTNISPIPNALEKIDKISGVEYDWTDEYIDRNNGEDGYFVRRHDVGVIAQEVEAVLPEVVATRNDGYKAVRYEKLVALLIQAVKEQNKRIDELEAKLNKCE
jgi:hypothetical protein